MGTGRFRMFSLWAMAVILLLWGVGQGNARPLTYPGGVPDYFETPNWANSPPVRKFVDTLPGLNSAGVNNLGQFIPVAVPDTTTYPTLNGGSTREYVALYNGNANSTVIDEFWAWGD